MATDSPPAIRWMLDSSTFIHALVIGRVQLIALVRSSACFPEYIYRVELGNNARAETREAAEFAVRRKQIGMQGLSLDDLDRIASIGAPRRIGLGELACAVLAERTSGGVLCDDWRAKSWIKSKVAVDHWESIEDVLLNAAQGGHISEFDLSEFQIRLQEKNYGCRCDLWIEHLQRRLNQ